MTTLLQNENNVILFLGYYNRKNLGDDLFYYIFKQLFGQYDCEIHFADPMSIGEIKQNVTMIICGGGDIVTDYFMKKIIALKYNWEQKYNKKLLTYGLSIGLTYPDHIIDGKSHYIDIFDHIVVRNKHDYNLISQRFGEDYVTYLPDIVVALPNYLSHIAQSHKHTIGMFLARPIYNNGLNKNYNRIVKLCQRIKVKIIN